MLTLYRPPSRASLESDNEQPVIPAGRPYLTKVNGKLVMARQKRDKPANIAVNLLGEAFGVRTRIVHKRSRSVDQTSPSLMVAGTSYVTPLQLPYSTPLPQQRFPALPQLLVPMQHFQSPIELYQQGNYPPPMYEHPTKYSVAPHKASAADFEELKKIDADYKSRANPAPTFKAIEDKEKTTIIITKHFCANCGRIRSRKHHHEHPIEPGETPIPAFCRKCLRDAISTDGSDSNRKPPSVSNPKKQSKNRPSEERMREDKAVHPEGVVVEVDPPEEEPKAKNKKQKKDGKNIKKKKEDKRAHSPEYVVVEEEYSEDEPAPRGRLRLEESDVGRRIPLPTRSYVKTSEPHVSRNHHNDRRKHDSSTVYETPHERSQSPQYRYVQPRKVSHQQGHQYATSCKQYNKPLLYERGRHSSRQYADYRALESVEHPRFPLRSHESFQARKMANREDTFESLGSDRSRTSSQRRRRERRYPDEGISRPWEAPHDIRPRSGDEKVVVTETYVYRPRRESGAREDGGQPSTRNAYSRETDTEQGKKNYDTRGKVSDFLAEDHAYYCNDWQQQDQLRDEDDPRRGRETRPRHCGYRQAKDEDSRLYSQASLLDAAEYQKAYDAIHHDLPRAPTPPAPLPETYQKQPAYPLSSDSETTRCLRKARKCKKTEWSATDHKPGRNTRERSISAHQTPFVREASDGDTEKALAPSPMSNTGDYFGGAALIPSPRNRSHSRSGDPFRDDNSNSDITERERTAERETGRKRVAFKDQSVIEVETLVSDKGETSGWVLSAEGGETWGAGGGEKWGVEGGEKWG